MSRLRWLTNAAFEIETSGTRITIDPCVRGMCCTTFDEKSYKKPDYVIVSHLHWDHIADLRYLYDTYSPIIISGNLGRESLIDYLDANHADIYPAVVNVELDFGSFKVKPIYAIHRNLKKKLNVPFTPDYLEKLKRLDPKMHCVQKMGTLEMMNYLLTLEDGMTILIWGGEFGVVQENMLRDLKPDVALVQYSPTMPDKLSRILDSIKAKKVIPYHHDISLTVNQWKPLLEDFKRSCPYEFVIMENGEEIQL